MPLESNLALTVPSDHLTLESIVERCRVVHTAWESKLKRENKEMGQDLRQKNVKDIDDEDQLQYLRVDTWLRLLNIALIARTAKDKKTANDRVRKMREEQVRFEDDLGKKRQEQLAKGVTAALKQIPDFVESP